MKLKVAILTTLTILLVPTLTYAIFFDKHTSSNNTFSATTLNSEIVTEFEQPITIYLTYKEPQTFSFALTNIGQLPTINSFETVKITNEKFANLIYVTAILDEKDIIYKEPITGLLATNYLTQNKKESNEISFTFEISQVDLENTPGEEVEFVIRHHAGQYPGIQNYGFFDKEDIHVKILNPLPAPLVKPSTILTPDNLIEQLLYNNEE